MRQILTLALAWVIVAAAPAAAQDIESGKDALWRGEFEIALTVFRPLSEQGNAEAQYHLASLYRDGRGVAYDPDAATVWFHRSAEGGYWWASLELGLLYWGQITAAPAEVAEDARLIDVHKWLGVAAAREPAGCVSIAKPLLAAAAASMNENQITVAENQTRNWLAEHPSSADSATDGPSC